ncbi:UDP-3-O-(3-hydroxymyristoyl)glucosamine N-acyltransferase [Pontivivens ytuae]|uniref:UDP-3-O-acylglucosamine N-acyltransferase n=1 Tax=Pontivivens ytuae TaxID=2789856 RepID=A0A7S9QCT8_9RHOB|nr:UDP-3-O-(3-hydroxymyristoyl)glucosamine N-acyltransferase [Pontivivens ytuae]QPH54573.1 UDP-3-O-(3-hydroxymyristoyl)glucosamine N-acyltransferase [Pontivivens ytuae]
MSLTIGDIAARLGAEAAGDLSLQVARLRQPDEAGAADLALAIDPEFAEKLKGRAVRAAVVADGADWQAMGLEAAIFSGRSRYTMAGLSRIFDRDPAPAPGIHPTAVIDPTATLGEGASVGPHAVIGAHVTLGPRARIAGQVTIGDRVTIGADAYLMPGCRIGSDVTIGDRFIGQANAVIGGDGFSFVTPQPNKVEDYMAKGSITESLDPTEYVRINSLGSVVIGDDVEVGANSVIDKGTVSDTRIGNGTKVDAQVMVGHNVQVGEKTLLCAMTGIAGSTEIGNRVVLAGGVGVADHISIGDDSIILAGSGVTNRVPPKSVMMGYPALKQEVFMNIFKAMRRLPRLAEKVTDLQNRVSKPDHKG